MRPGETMTPLTGAAARGAHSFDNTGLVWGPGDDLPNEDGRDLLHGDAAPPDFLFGNYAFTADELAALKALAISTGTFYRASPVVFGAHAPLPSGDSVVYVEGDIEIDPYGDDTAWTGWLLAVSPTGSGGGGRLAFRCAPGCPPAWGRLTVNGLLYAEDRFEVDTQGANRALAVNGAVITRNLGGTPNRIVPERAADVRIRLRCQGDGGERRGVRDAIAGTADTIGVFDPERPVRLVSEARQLPGDRRPTLAAKHARCPSRPIARPSRAPGLRPRHRIDRRQGRRAPRTSTARPRSRAARAPRLARARSPRAPSATPRPSRRRSGKRWRWPASPAGRLRSASAGAS